jgi:hypothetical protein
MLLRPETDVPRISEFFGMSVYMYWFDTQRHKLPHFHVRYQGLEAVFALNGDLVEGNLGARAHRLLQEWARERAADVKRAWECAASGKEIPWILPIQ